MIDELVLDPNGSEISDPFKFLTNNKIPKIRDAKDVPEGYLEMFNLMEKTFDSLREFRENEVVTGVIASITEKEFFVDFFFLDKSYLFSINSI